MRLLNGFIVLIGQKVVSFLFGTANATAGVIYIAYRAMAKKLST